MVTKIVKVGGNDFFEELGGGRFRRAEYYGKSTDAKPTTGVRNADIYYEMDTQEVFLFDADGGSWLKQ